MDEIEREELRSLTMETRLQQMIASWCMAVGLGFSFEPGPSEMNAFERRIILKEKK